MCNFLMQNEEFKWIKACNKSWEWMRLSMTCLLVLMVPNLKIKFHVDTYASNFALRFMLGPNNTIDRPIYYASRLMNRAKKNYTTIENEVLAMIYAMKFF